ncbi:hypothetical protein R6Z07F_007031 [Ovis aries]
MDTGSVTRPDNPLPSQQPTDPQATLRNQEGERAQSPASWEHQVSRRGDIFSSSSLGTNLTIHTTFLSKSRQDREGLVHFFFKLLKFTG